MKKISLILALCFVANPVWAGSWETDSAISLGNFYGYTDYASPYNRLHKRNNLNSSLDIYGRVTYEFDADYAMSVIGNFAVDSAKKIENYNQGIWGEEIYTATETKLGDILIGQNKNVAYNFAVGAPNVGPYHVNNTEIVNFISNPNWYKKGHRASYKTLNSTYINTDGSSLKASYITPEFSGLKLGISYIPETYSQSGLVAENAPYKDKSAYVLGAYGGWNILGYELETSLGFANYKENDKEYTAGASIYRKGWTLGGSYRKTEVSQKDYAINKENLFDAYREGTAYNLGISYNIGPFTTGLSYFDSKAQKTSNEDKIISFSNSYEYNKNLALSVTLAHLKSQGNEIDAKDNSKGYALIFGVELKL